MNNVGQGPLHLAIDLGVSGGRGVLGRLSPEGLRFEEVHRFAYPPATAKGHLRWPFGEILAGIKEALREGRGMAMVFGGTLETIGVDAWGADYGFVDAGGQLLEDPVCYRDRRTDGAIERVLQKLSREEVFGKTGMPLQPFNTLFQLHAHAREGLPAAAKRLLMIPDLCHHALCGSRTGEYTNATTTQLVDLRTRRWADELFSRLDLPRELMPEIVEPGTILGEIDPSLQKELEVGALRVIAPATHDTASAMAGTPLRPGWAFLFCGTWSRLGVERDAPIVTPAAAGAGFTNEGGGAGVRFLKNLMGLWILESCRTEWAARGEAMDQGGLRAALAGIEEVPGVVFPDDARFVGPKAMTAELLAALAETGQQVPEEPVFLTKVILDSLAFRYASVVREIEAVTGASVAGIHAVGTGALNDYLNQAIADAAGRPVLAGPADATAVGNLMLQAIASGGIGSLAEGRGLLERALRLRRYEPRERTGWGPAGERYREIEQKHVSGER